MGYVPVRRKVAGRPKAGRPFAGRANDTEAAVAPWETGLVFGMWDARALVGSDGDLVGTLAYDARSRLRVDLAALTVARPFLRTGANGLNGRPTLRYNDQTTDHTANVMHADALGTQFAGNDTACWCLVVGVLLAAASNSTWWAVGRSSTSTPNLRMYLESATDKHRMTRADDAAVTVNQSAQRVIAVGTPYVLGFRFTGRTADLWLNGAQVYPAVAMDVGMLTLNQFSTMANKRMTTTGYINGKQSLLLVGLGIPSFSQMRGMSVWAAREFGVGTV